MRKSKLVPAVLLSLGILGHSPAARADAVEDNQYYEENQDYRETLYQNIYMTLVRAGLSHEKSACVAKAMQLHPGSAYAQAGGDIVGRFDLDPRDPTGYIAMAVSLLEQENPCAEFDKIAKHQKKGKTSKEN